MSEVVQQPAAVASTASTSHPTSTPPASTPSPLVLDRMPPFHVAPGPFLVITGTSDPPLYAAIQYCPDRDSLREVLLDLWQDTEECHDAEEMPQEEQYDRVPEFDEYGMRLLLDDAIWQVTEATALQDDGVLVRVLQARDVLSCDSPNGVWERLR